MIRFKHDSFFFEASSPAHLIQSLCNFRVLKTHILPAVIFQVARVRDNEKLPFELLRDEKWIEMVQESGEPGTYYEIEIHNFGELFVKHTLVDLNTKKEKDMFLLKNMPSLFELKLAIMEELQMASDIEINVEKTEVTDKNFRKFNFGNPMTFEICELGKETSSTRLRECLNTTMANRVKEMNERMKQKQKMEEINTTQKIMKMLVLEYSNCLNEEENERKGTAEKTKEMAAILKAKTEILEKKLPQNKKKNIFINQEQKESTFDLQIKGFDNSKSQIELQLKIATNLFEEKSKYILKFFVDRAFVGDAKVPPFESFKKGKATMKIPWSKPERNMGAELSFRIYHQYSEEMASPEVTCSFSVVHELVEETKESVKGTVKEFEKFEAETYQERLEEMGKHLLKTVQLSLVNSEIPELNRRAYSLQDFQANLLNLIETNFGSIETLREELRK